MAVLYLTKQEMAKFKKLPKDVVSPSEFDVEEETSKAFESKDQMAFRFSLLDVENHEGAKKVAQNVIKKLQSGGDIEDVSLDDLTDEDLQMFFSSIGANGVSFLIDVGLAEANCAEEMERLASLSAIRHGLLKSNEEFFASSHK